MNVQSTCVKVNFVITFSRHVFFSIYVAVSLSPLYSFSIFYAISRWCLTSRNKNRWEWKKTLRTLLNSHAREAKRWENNGFFHLLLKVSINVPFGKKTFLQFSSICFSIEVISRVDDVYFLFFLFAGLIFRAVWLSIFLFIRINDPFFRLFHVLCHMQ